MIRPADQSDAEALTQLINRAFQVEKFFIDTERISPPQTLDYLRKGVFLVNDDDGVIAACIYIELRGDRAYFGLLSVDPERQRAAIGKQMIAAAEAFCREAGCRFLDILVVNLRQELPPYYRKLGYAESGTSEFPADVETKMPCHFIQMTKAL